ncbi:MAG: hypothetical protein ACI37Q_04450 [Candidatus Gastranaerophilaceae bacterium]
MKISKFRKYITWNIISIMGYFCSVITLVFAVMLMLSGSQLNMRADLNAFFYDYINAYIINPYYIFYKAQLFLIVLMLILSVYENGYYKRNEKYGLRIFSDDENTYSMWFVTGIALNFIPMYIVTTIIFITFVRLI